MRRKHSRMMAIILSTIILAGCSNSSHLSVSQTHSSPSATAQPRPTAEPLAVSVSPERSCYQQLYDQPDNPNWALYAEITITNYTDQPLTIETIFLYPNHQFYGEDASTPVLLPEDAIVALRETGLWELHIVRLLPCTRNLAIRGKSAGISFGVGSRTITNRKYIYSRRNGYDHRLADGTLYAGCQNVYGRFQLLRHGHCAQRKWLGNL